MANDFIMQVPRNTLPRPRQTSPLLPDLDPSGVPLMYRMLADAANHSQAMSRQAQLLNARISRVERRGSVDDALPNFHPFKIYKPDVKIGSFDGVSNWLNFTGICYTFDADGVLQTGFFDSSQPTNFDNGNINPITDGWRIWAVRTGLISTRGFQNSQTVVGSFDPGNNAFIMMPDGSVGVEVVGCDEYNIGFRPEQTGSPYGFPYEFNPANDDGHYLGVIPIVLPETFVDNASNYMLALWIETRNLGGPQLFGKAYDMTTVDKSTIFPQPTTSQVIPVGAIGNQGWEATNIATETDGLTAYQLIYGNIISTFGAFNNSFVSQGINNPLAYSATLNYRGNWKTDAITALGFYPGDVVQYEEQLTIGGTAVYSQSLFMCGVLGGTSNPSVDPNWVRISGITLASQTTRTPNTH